MEIRIVIPDAAGNVLKKMRSKKVALIIGLLLPAVVVTTALSVSSVFPVAFQSGEVISSSEVNAAFNELDQRLQRLESGGGIPLGTAVQVSGWEGQVMPRTTWTTLQNEVVDLDTIGEFDTSRYAFTATEAGTYHASCWGYVTPDETMLMSMVSRAIRVARNDIIEGESPMDAFMSTGMVQFSEILQLDAGDELECRGYSNHGDELWYSGMRIFRLR